jgi:hypothetical protein
VSLGDARLLFDECIGWPSIKRLAELVEMGRGDKPEVRHVLQLAPAGTRDEDWIPKIASEGWTVISADGGRWPRKNKGEKLPRLCANHKITHVLLSPAIHMLPSFDKLLTILSVWYQLLEISADSDQKGSRYVLEPTANKVRGHGRLVPRAIKPPKQTLE